MRNGYRYVQEYKEDVPSTHNGLNLKEMTMAELYAYFQLEEATIEFIGHALALHTNEDYFHEPALQTVLKVKLYHESLMRFAGTRSPYIYPLYGLGELPQVTPRSESSRVQSLCKGVCEIECRLWGRVHVEQARCSSCV